MSISSGSCDSCLFTTPKCGFLKTFKEDIYTIHADDSWQKSGLKASTIFLSLASIGLFALLLMVPYAIYYHCCRSNAIYVIDNEPPFMASFQGIFPKNPAPIVQSIKRIVGKNCPQIAVYGLFHCGYTQLRDYLNTGSAIRAVGYTAELPHTYAEKSNSIQHQCKATLTKLVLENYLREQRGDPIIPVLFLTDVDGNPYPLSTLYDKVENGKRRMTASEINRARKLCTDPSLPEEIRRVARSTFFFCKTKLRNGAVTGLEHTPWPPDQTPRGPKGPHLEPDRWREWLCLSIPLK